MAGTSPAMTGEGQDGKRVMTGERVRLVIPGRASARARNPYPLTVQDRTRRGSICLDTPWGRVPPRGPGMTGRVSFRKDAQRRDGNPTHTPRRFMDPIRAG